MVSYPYIDWLSESMNYMEYPETTITFVLNTYKKICDNKRANMLFHDALKLYEKQLCPAWVWALTAAERAADEIGVHRFTSKFIISLCVTKHVKTFYEQKGMPDGCFDGFLKDIKIKWAECVALHKIDGVFVADWFNRFVDGTRHTFGRLQFEPIFIAGSYYVCGRTVNEGDLTINIHIPGGSKLTKQDCIDSFLKAAEYYAPLFEDGTVVFHCSSWLLYEKHNEFLPETSALLMFADFFNIAETTEGRHHLWRIFNREDCEDTAALPENTSLQRAFKNRLLSGGEIGASKGFFFVKDNLLIK